MEREIKIGSNGSQEGNPYRATFANGETKEFRSKNDTKAKYRAYRIGRDNFEPRTNVTKLVAIEEASKPTK
jgi:hypothetical protein